MDLEVSVLSRQETWDLNDKRTGLKTYCISPPDCQGLVTETPLSLVTGHGALVHVQVGGLTPACSP